MGKTFPISMGKCPYAGPRKQIPWEVAEKAYADYVRRFGNSQSLERLKERGGFSEYEMDMFYPDWRRATDE